MPSAPHRFIEPDWDAPIDSEAALRSIPSGATISGMFLQPMVEMARSLGHALPEARPRYVAFTFYPLREHVSLMLASAPLLFPKAPPRQALRKLGRAAPQALLQSMVGRVMLGSASGVRAMIDAMARAYPVNLKPCSATVIEADDHHAIVTLRDVHYFLDCHHVGAFEGLLKHAGVEGTVRIAARSDSDADFCIEWG